jgi:hypothetical protein
MIRTDSEFCGDLATVLSSLSNDRLAILCETLAVALVVRGVSPRLGFMRCALELRELVEGKPEPAKPIHSDDCSPPMRC